MSVPESVSSVSSSAFAVTGFIFQNGICGGNCYKNAGNKSFVLIDNSNGACGEGLSYSIDDGGTLLITGKGAMDDYSRYGAPWYPFYDIKDVIVGSGVTYIGDNAFYDNRSIESVTISGASSIGSRSFAKCSSLVKVTIKSGCPSMGTSAFDDCDSLNTVVFGSGGSSIGNRAFFDCDTLSSVTIGAGSSFIGDEAFDSCDSLASVSLGECQSIGDNAFRACSRLSAIIIPETVTYIGEGAFFKCTEIAYVTIPGSLDYLGDLAFYPIEFYERATLLDYTVKDLSGKTFEGSNGILYAKMSMQTGDTISTDGLIYTVTSQEPITFQVTGYDGSLKNVIIPSVIAIAEEEYAVTSIGKQAFYGCSSLVSIDLGNVSEIGVKAFANCTKLKTVAVGDSLKTISAYGFYRCTSLASIDLEDSAKTLRAFGSYSFYKCSKLASVAVPSFMTTIGSYAFSFPFEDEDGNDLEATVESLKGYVYRLSGGAMVRQPGIEVGIEFESGGLRFTTTASLPAEVEVSGYSASVKNLRIPSEVADSGATYAVTAIGENAFKGCSALRSADLGSVEKIGKQAFYGCTKLAGVTGEKVRSIGVKAFAYCSALSSAEFGDDLRTISAYAFCKCKSLQSFYASDVLKTVGSYVFYKCPALSEVHTGESLKKIGSCAFASCPGIESIDLPGTLKSVGSKAFSGLTFQGSGGNVLPQTAKALRGHSFEGSGGVLVASS